MEFITWCNSNQGFVMCMLTLVYVIATIFICIFNYKSAVASENQISSMKKQQSQNTGVQLYELRKNVMKLFSDKAYNDMFWDIQLLFDKKISDDFQSLAFSQSRLEEHHRHISEYESRIKEDLGQDEYELFLQIQVQCENNKSDSPYEALYDWCKKYKPSVTDLVTGETYRIDYKEINENSIKLYRKISVHHTQLFMDMQKFIKDSISEKEMEE